MSTAMRQRVDEPFSPSAVKGTDASGLPPYVSNGVVGLRVPTVPWFDSYAVLNGAAGIHPDASIESVPRVPSPLGGDLSLDGVWMSEARHLVRPIEQRYDFGCGELTSTYVFGVDDVHARVTVLTFASRTQPTVVCQQSVVELDRAADVEIRATVSPGGIPGEIVRREQGVPGSGDTVVDGTMRWCPAGELSFVGLAYATELDGHSEDVQREFGQQRVGAIHTTYRFRGRANRRVRLNQYASLVPDRVHHDVDRQATRLVALAASLGIDELRTANHDAWRDLWKGRVVVLGAERRWQELADAAFFYLHTSVHGSSLASSNIFGLAQWSDYHYYYGHVMWDLEMFAVPPLLLTQPAAARALLDYRYRSLDAARYNAVQWGYRGAQFPWQSGPLSGEEAAPEIGSAAMYEHHVSMGVAHAAFQYASATCDERFLREQAWPILAEVAEWLTSRAERTRRGFEIRRAMGIAEREQPSDNVAYVNMAAWVALDDAIRAAARLGRPAPASWPQIRDGLVLPMDGDVVLDHDDYRPGEEKGATPATLCGLFPLGYPTTGTVEEATIRFYLDMADDYVGSPMLSALYGAWAAMIGDRRTSARLLDEGYAKFVSDRFMITHEYRADRFPEQPVAGPFVANIGAFLTVLLYGLTGLRISDAPPESWPERRVTMPEGWDGIEVEQVWIAGRPAHLRACHGDERATIEMI
jgi:hypothetical protein